MVSKLADLYTRLRARARLTQAPQAQSLPGGATIIVSVKDGTYKTMISRFGVPLGDKEIEVFHQHFAIPDRARRSPAAGQGQRPEAGGVRHWVGWTWTEEAAL